MSLHDDLRDLMDLAGKAMSDKKAEKQRKEEERRKIQLICPYCGSVSLYTLEEGNLPKCPNCGSPFDEENEQLKKIREEREQEVEAERRVYEAQAIEKARTKSRIRRYIIIGILVIVLLIAAVILAKLNGGSLKINGGFNFHVE